MFRECHMFKKVLYPSTTMYIHYKRHLEAVMCVKGSCQVNKQGVLLKDLDTLWSLIIVAFADDIAVLHSKGIALITIFIVMLHWWCCSDLDPNAGGTGGTNGRRGQREGGGGEGGRRLCTRRTRVASPQVKKQGYHLPRKMLPSSILFRPCCCGF